MTRRRKGETRRGALAPPGPLRRRRSITTTRQLLLALVLVLPAACGHPGSDLLRLGTVVWPGYEPLYLARDLGLLDEHRIRLVEFASSSRVMRAFREARVDAAALTLDETLQLRAAGSDPRVVLVLDESEGGDAVVGGPGVENLEDLRGRRVGVESGALGAYLLSRALDRAGLPPDSVEAVPLIAGEQEEAFRKGEVDAVVTFEPVLGRILAAGGRVLFDSSEIPGEVVDVLVVRGPRLSACAGLVAQLSESWFAAIDYIEEHRSEAFRRMMPRLKTPLGELPRVFSGLKLAGREENRKLLLPAGGRPPPLLGAAERLRDYLSRRGLVKGPLDVEKILKAPRSLHR